MGYRSSPLELVVATLDLDIYKRVFLGRSDLVLGGGFRSAGFQSVVPNTVENTILSGGVSLFSELRHVLLYNESSEFAVVGGGRVSFLTGEWESKVNSDILEVDTDVTISEGAIGVEWSRKIGKKSLLILRGQYETQLWDSDVTSDLAFNGGVVRVGLNW